MNRAWIGGSIWLAIAFVWRPTPWDVAWAQLILMLGPLVLVPLGLTLVRGGRDSVATRVLAIADRAQLPAATLLCGSLLLPQGLLAACLAMPWLMVTALVAAAGCVHVHRHRRGDVHELCLGAAMIFLVVGGMWAVVDRLGLRPLDFKAVIVLLTAIHFHFAGFVLPLTTGLALRRVNCSGGTLVGIGVLTGVPLVAIGITATQLGAPPWLEAFAAMWLATTGMAVAGLHLLLARRSSASRLARSLWLVAAASLMFSMVLALMYGLRFYLPLPWLDIPWMRALHGTANALGFALPVFAGWSLALYGQTSSKDAEVSTRTHRAA